MAKAGTSARRPRQPAALSAYRKKRDLTASGEPAGGKRRAANAPAFVIQKHDATRLHYDFRLEAHGVLKSWAVPKGLPARPGEKALAIEVEDHPLDYGTFEGTIPEGNYGAGTVMVWDRGQYAVEGGDFDRAYHAGKLHVALAGEKLSGEWTLVRLRPKKEESKSSWLIIQNRSAGRLPQKAGQAVSANVSVLTARTMSEIAAGKKTTRRQKAPAKPASAGKVEADEKAEFPRFVEPMKALGVTVIPAGKWLTEIKFDGYRALVAVQPGRSARLWSRNENDLTGDYPEIAEALGRLRCEDALIDGEIVALDAHGHSRFQLLQQRSLAQTRPPIFYYAFDLLQLNGRSLQTDPIEQRRARLEKLLANAPDGLRLSRVMAGDPAKVLQHARRLGLEGVVAKAAGSPYEPGRRSGAWLKCRISNEQEFVLGGFTPPAGARRYFGALLVGYYAGNRLQYAGKVGTGFDGKLLAEIHALLTKRTRSQCPFANLPITHRSRFGTPMNAAAMARVHWVRPDLVAQIRFAEWIDDGLLRQPVFLGLRRDKSAQEVVREASALSAMTSPKP